MERCTKCEGAVTAAELPAERKVAGVRFTGKVRGWRCSACDATFIDGPSLGEFELFAAGELLTRGAPAGEALRFARKSLGYTGVALGELLGVRPETLSRWEAGERPAEPRVVVLLASLVGDALQGSTATADRLRAAAVPTKGARTIDLDAVRERLRATTESLLGTEAKSKALDDIAARKRTLRR